MPEQASATINVAQTLHSHTGSMADGTDGFGQVVEVMKTPVLAREGRHVFGPRREDEQRAVGTGLESTALRFPEWTDGVGLQVYQTQLLLQGEVLYPLFTLRDAGGDQYIATPGS